MTNKEALVAVCQVSVDDNVLEKALADQDVTAADTYASSGSDSINKAAIDVLEGVLSRANVSEGGFSESFDRKAIENRLKILYSKTGKINPGGAVIRDVSNRW